MNFLEAVEEMEKGKIVEDEFRDRFKLICGKIYFLNYNFNWELSEQTPFIFAKKTFKVLEEPKKTLWDFMCRSQKLDSGSLVFKYDKVKEALKEYREWVYEKLRVDLLEADYNKAKEIFGEEMLKK